MLRIPGTPPVKTRLPVAAWAIASVVTLFSLMSTVLHMSPLSPPAHQAMPQAEQGAEPQEAVHQAKV
jgi:hypothetical protein